MDFESAKQCVDSLLPFFDKISLIFRNEINCERIFLELIDNCDKAFIHEIYDKNLKRYIKAAKFMISKKRFLMAYEDLYNEDKNKALEHYEAAKVLASKYPIKGEADTELRIMEWVKEKLQADL
jgi:folate-dependent tRNA-U54 methylase TrmFO/GidA